MQRVTISDVAKAAGVSMKSVSRVINREPNVSEKLRDKVQVAIDALGYVPDLAARSLAGGRSFAMGILLDNPSPNYTMKLLTGAYRACREHGYHLQIENIASDRDDLAEQLEVMLQNIRIDGFILTPPLSGCGTTMAALEERGIPFVRLAPDGFPDRGPGIAIDDEKAAYLVGEHLIGLGHSRFGFVQGPTSHVAATARRAGLLAALSAHGLEPPVEVYGGFDFEKSILAGQQLMQQQHRPTAIFASNDDSAAGIMAALAQLGVKVPDEVSIVGFDDSWVARSVWPNLTTIYQPIAEMAEAAVNMLLDRNGALQQTGTVLMDYHLVARNSTAGAPSA